MFYKTFSANLAIFAVEKEMSKLKDIWKNSIWNSESKEKRSFFRYVVVSTLLCLIFLCVKRDSLITWVSAAITLHRQERQIEYLKEQNSAIRARVKQLTENKDSLERFAREEYLFAEPGDDIYVMP